MSLWASSERKIPFRPAGRPSAREGILLALNTFVYLKEAQLRRQDPARILKERVKEEICPLDLVKGRFLDVDFVEGTL